MAYNAYQPHRPQHHSLPRPYHYHSYSHHPPPSYPLKPLQQTTVTTTTSYTPLAPSTTNNPQRPSPQASSDSKHKRRIRLLKLASRLVGFALSLATFATLAMTSAKFLQTQDEVVVVDGETRTAWALGGSETWYHYLYFAIATISLVVNGVVLMSYCCTRGVKASKVAETAEGWWAGVQRGGEIFVWVAAVAVYRIGQEADEEGKFKDLWGWTCSPAAREIQGQVPNVENETYCDVQTTSFYTGILTALAAILTASIYAYAIVRMRSKKALRKATLAAAGGAMEPLRT